jgi:hypothetical protein
VRAWREDRKRGGAFEIPALGPLGAQGVVAQQRIGNLSSEAPPAAHLASDLRKNREPIPGGSPNKRTDQRESTATLAGHTNSFGLSDRLLHIYS